MTDLQKINNLREMVEYATVIIGDCKHFVYSQFTSTVGREELLKRIEGYELYLNENFKPEVINGTNQ
jgi:hypothetical protein